MGERDFYCCYVSLTGYDNIEGDVCQLEHGLNVVVELLQALSLARPWVYQHQQSSWSVVCLYMYSKRET